MKTPNTNPKGLPASVLRPAKAVKVTFKPTSTVEAAPAPYARGEGFAMRALVKLREAQRGNSAALAYDKKTGTYDGAELRPYDGRPGCNQALALPSLMGGKRIYRNDQTTPEAQT